MGKMYHNDDEWKRKIGVESLISQPLKFLRNGSVTRESCQVLH